jgi:GT2 family glycosyltransferase
MYKKEFNFATIFINYNSTEDILALIRKMKLYNLKMLFLVYDNSPTDAFKEQILALNNDDIHYFSNDTNPGYCHAVNHCFSELKTNYSKIPYIGLLNSDIEFDESVFTISIRELKQDEKLIAVNPMIYDGDNQIWYSGGYFNRKKLYISSNLPQGIKADDCDFYNGSFVIFSNKVLDFKMDEGLFMYYDEFDISQDFKLKNYKIKLIEDAKIIHHVSKSLENFNHVKVYYKTRNYLYVLRKRHYKGKFFVFKLFTRYIISFLRRGQFRSAKFLLLGIGDCYRGKMGKLQHS